MTNIYTTTDNAKIRYPGIRRIDRQAKTGWLFHVAGNGTSLQVWRSTDKGATWATFGGAYTIPGGYTALELGSLFIDWQNRLYLPYRVNTGGQDRVYLYTGVITSTFVSPHSQLLLAAANNGGVAGSIYSGMAPGVVRHSDGRTTGFVAVGYSQSGNLGVGAFGFTIPAVGQPVLNNAIIKGNRYWYFPQAAGHQVPSVDYELSPAHMWITWGRTVAAAVKLTWNGAGWNGPSASSFARLSQTGSSVPAPPATDSMPGVWRNPGWCVAQPYQNDTTNVVVWERNQANTKTTAYITPAHPQGVVTSCTLAIDWATRNIRVYAVGTSNASLYYIDYVTATASWGTWSNTAWTITSSGTVADNYSVRRRTDGSARYDILRMINAASPFQVASEAQTVAYAPNAPTWIYSTYDLNPYRPPANGAPMSADDELDLAWAFSDPDSADTQSAYALSLQNGATTYWWRQTDHTWVPGTEIKNVLTPSGVLLNAGWAAAGDPMVTIKVKVWDQSDAASPYSEALLLKPSAVSLATITTPPNDVSVYTTPEMDIAWTVAEQSAFRLDLYQTEAGEPNPLLWTSGWVQDSDTRSYHIPYALSSGQYAIRLRTKNNDGLEWPAPNWPIGLRRLFTVNITAPPAPTIVVTPQSSTASINVAITNPGPAFVNPNPGFETDTSNWVGTNGTLTRSTAQAHTGVASGRFVPNGSSVSVYPEMTSTHTGAVGSVWTCWGWIRPDTDNGKPARANIHWFNGATYVSTSSVDFPVAAAGTWQKVAVTAAQPSGTTRAVGAIGRAGTPAAGDAFYVDDVWLMTGAQPEVIGNIVQRRLAGDTTLESLVTVATDVPVGSTYADWTAASGVAYEYRVGAVGDNQGISYSAWTA